MGLTIHYSGKLRSPSCLKSLLTESMDIAESMGWAYDILPDHPEIPVHGVLISPEGSEPLWLTFHEDGTLCNPILYELALHEGGAGIPPDAEQWLFTKTQYAGVEAHMAMITFMRFLSQKYFERFELHDESHYWETGDEAMCRQIFEKYNLLMDMVGAALDSMENIPDESVDSLVERIDKMLHERFGVKRDS